MPQVIFAPAAIRDLERLRAFLYPKNPSAARRAATTIKKLIQGLAEYPRMGRPIEHMAVEYRELLVHFGKSGYAVIYQYCDDSIVILAIRHQRETALEVATDKS